MDNKDYGDNFDITGGKSSDDYDLDNFDVDGADSFSHTVHSEAEETPTIWPVSRENAVELRPG